MARPLANYFSRNFLAGYEEDPRDFPLLGGWRPHDRPDPEPERVILPTSGVAGNGKIIFDWDQAALQLTRESPGWGLTLGVGATVTYAFRSTAPAVMPDDAAGFSQFSAAQIAATETVLALWSDVANITFVRIAPGGYNNNATILFANYSSGVAGASAFAFVPTAPVSTLPGSLDGDVWVNISVPDNQDLTPGGFGMHVLAHEIGHAIGLSHPGDYNGAGADYALNAVYWQDSRAFTVMSYFGSPNVGATLPEFSPGPQFHDIAAVQRLYGPRTTTRTGDTIYGFNSNAGREHYTLTSATVGATFAIWDGGGNDTLDLSGYSENADIDLRPGAHSSAGPTDTGPAVYNIAIALGVTIENAIGGVGNDTLTGNAAANRLDGGAGADSMAGGAGNDTYVVDAAGDTVTELAGEGIETVESAVNNYTLGANLENLILAADTANGGGNSLNNAVTGNALANILWGSAGNDTLDGGAGADQLDGGAGDDTYVIDDVGDFTWEAASAGTDTVISSVNNYSLRNNFENIVLAASIANGGGNSLNNAVTGNALDNIIWGGAGDDTLDGGAGADQFNGEAGNDTYIIDDVSDFVWEAANAGTDTVISSVNNYSLRNNFENIVLAGAIANGGGNSLNNSVAGNAADNILWGGGGNDALSGGTGADQLDGGADADTLDGGLGADQLFGGTSADTFVFNSALGDGNIDSVLDFNVIDDVIHLNVSVFSAIGAGALSANSFVTGAAAADADDRIIYNAVTGALLYDADGSGAGAATQFATLAAGLTLSNDDFFGFGP